MEILVGSLLDAVSRSATVTDKDFAYIVNNQLLNDTSDDDTTTYLIQKLDVINKSEDWFSFCPVKLAQILKTYGRGEFVKLTRDQKEFEIKGETVVINRTIFKIAKGTYTINGGDITEEIKKINIDTIDESNSVEVSTDDFFEIISQSMKFINLKDARQRLHGMYFDRSNGFINTYACNGHAIYNGQFKADIEPGKNFIHRTVMKSLNGMKKYIDKLTIVFTRYETIFKSSDMIYYNKVSDVAMTNFIKAIGYHQDSRFDILTKDIDKIKKFIKPLAKNEDTTKEPNFLRFKGYINDLTISGKCESSSAFSGFSCSFEEPLEITKDFNYKSTSDILSCFKNEATIKLHNDKLIVEDRLRTIVLLGLK